jgi:hypothetical protein
MKYVALFVLAVLAVSPIAFAQASSPDIDKAVMAAPANLRDGATVVKWKADFSYDTLRKGTNHLVCYDMSGMPEQLPVMIECTNMENLDRVAQNLKFQASGDKTKTQAMLDSAEKDGSRVKPLYGSVWYHVMGPDKDHARTHMTIAVPNATTATTGLPDNPKTGGVWIMNAGTTTAHLMTPGE